MLFLFSHKILNQRFASLGDIPVGCLEIARVPGVGNVAATVGEVKELQDLAVGIKAKDAVHITYICAIHTDEQVVFAIVGTGELSCFTAVKGDIVFRQDGFSASVNVIPDLLGRGGGGFCAKYGIKSTFFLPYQEIQILPWDCGRCCHDKQTLSFS